MFDSDTGMSSNLGFSGSDSTDNLKSVMSDSYSSMKSFFNISNEICIPRKSFWRNKIENKPIPKLLEEVLYIEYRIKDDNAVWKVITSLSEKYSCKPHMTIFNEDFLGKPRYCAVRFSSYDKDNLEKAANEFKLDFNKIKTARLLSKEYEYEALNIVQTDNQLSGTIVVPAFSKVKKLTHVIADSLNMQCTITEHKTSLFANKTISFETRGISPNLDCFKKLFEHYLVPKQSAKKRKIF